MIVSVAAATVSVVVVEIRTVFFAVCFFVFVVNVVEVVVPTTFVVLVVGSTDRQSQALVKVGPEAHGLRAEGSLTVAGLTFLLELPFGGHVLEITVNVPSEFVSVKVVVLFK